MVYPFFMNLSPLARLMMLIAVSVIMLRAFIPMGYMPDLTQGKVFAMTICSIDGAKTVMVDEKFHPVTEKQSIHKSMPCEFSTLQHAFLNTDFAVHKFAPVDLAAAQDNVLQNSVFIPAAFRGAHTQAQAPPV